MMNEESSVINLTYMYLNRIIKLPFVLRTRNKPAGILLVAATLVKP